MKPALLPTAARAPATGSAPTFTYAVPLGEEFINREVISAGVCSVLLVGRTEVPAEVVMAAFCCFYPRAEVGQTLATNTWARQKMPSPRCVCGAGAPPGRVGCQCARGAGGLAEAELGAPPGLSQATKCSPSSRLCLSQCHRGCPMGAAPLPRVGKGHRESWVMPSFLSTHGGSSHPAQPLPPPGPRAGKPNPGVLHGHPTKTPSDLQACV